MEKINVQLFGSLRDLESSGVLQIEVDLPIPASAFKKQIGEKLASAKKSVDIQALLKSSALATGKKILGDAEMVTAADVLESLALLPPVCGG